ncbi:uncharacterized protein (TIGR00369 family) [Prescottella agglutinans]|uniref:Uncharacterized protein (TIGR00369 family) n=2 Tax=Prescottella agglutinans TaxID=1644129 RepID=A0ABT6MM16_9NOCA|nr:uncharacterized protein (TIGR00369 family) [Prescottella agglutinans]
MRTRETTDLRFVSSGPEALFRITEPTGDDSASAATMTTGQWLADSHGNPIRGSIGVLMDDTMGHLISGVTSGLQWAVSTEIHLDYAADPPTDGSTLRAEGELMAISPGSGQVRGQIRDESGRLIASGSTRLHVVAVDTPPGAPVLDKKLLQDRLDARSLMQLVDAQWLLGEDETMTAIEFGPSPALANPMGNVHGGVLLCVSELAGTNALGADTHFRTTSINISYIRPCRADQPVIVTPTILHKGRNLGIVQVDSRNRDGKVCSSATVTCGSFH